MSSSHPPALQALILERTEVVLTEETAAIRLSQWENGGTNSENDTLAPWWQDHNQWGNGHW